jgi:hypothetical protein
MEESIRLANSVMDGSRHPFRPPMVLVTQCVLDQMFVVAIGDLSHTRPVSLSRTASLLKSCRMVKRDALGRFLFQFMVFFCLVR